MANRFIDAEYPLIDDKGRRYRMKTPLELEHEKELLECGNWPLIVYAPRGNSLAYPGFYELP